MTTIVISTTQRFQYASDALLVGELMVSSPDLFSTVLDLVHGFNASGNARFFQLFNLDAVPAPGTVPLISFPVPAGQPFSWMPASPGFIARLNAPQGVSWWVSTTGDTYTASADTFWVNATGRGVMAI